MKKNFYAVGKGRETGIFGSWDEAKEKVSGFKGAVYKGFKTWEEAEEWFEDYTDDQERKTKEEKKEKENEVHEESEMYDVNFEDEENEEKEGKEEKSEKKSMSERIKAFIKENESEMDSETRRLLVRAADQAKVAER